MVNNLPWPLVSFETLLTEPLRNGIYKKKEFHGRGCKIVNMGELFKYPRLNSDVEMNLVELSDKEKEKSLLQTGDLIFARRSLTAEGAGKCTLIYKISEDTTFESSIIRARLDPNKALPEFYYYLFNSPIGKWLLGTILRQTAVAGITGSDLAKLMVPCPPISLQKELVEHARVLDNKIDINNQLNQTLEQMAQTLFKSWFVDFDPVKAKMNGEQPKGMETAITALFPEKLVESELGLIPEGWEVKSVGEFTDTFDYVANGSFAALKANVELYDEPNDVLYVRTTDFNKGFKNDLKYTDQSSYQFLAKSKLYGHETIISNVGDVGTVFRAPSWYEMPMTLGSNAMGIVSEGANSYIYYLFKSHIGQHLLDGITSGSAQMKFNKTSFRKLRVVLPSNDLLAKFEELEGSLWAKHASNQKESLYLEKLRDTLLPKLISGEVRLDSPEVEQAKALVD
ncbi:restriction endonuclease subunit S [Vibrio harveyi]